MARRHQLSSRVRSTLAATWLAACVGDDPAAPSTHADAAVDASEQLGDAGFSAEPDTSPLPYARQVASFAPGPFAGFGARYFPEIVLGPPEGSGPLEGSLDVLSLGTGGEIVLDFGERGIIDGDGPDFIVFENPFWPGNQPTRVFADLGEVSVSDDGASWLTFACDIAGAGMGRYPGCAGWTPTLEYDPFEVLPLDPQRTGGDVFDLATVGVANARYVRIRDLASSGEGDNAGFDLDAVGVIHSLP